MKPFSKRATAKALVQMGYPKWTPTENDRKRVSVFAFNRVPHERIAELIGCSAVELQHHFWRELSTTEEEALGRAAANVLDISTQPTELGLKAAQMVLQSRSKYWRVPKEVDHDHREAANKPAVQMTLAQIDAELEALEAIRLDETEETTDEDGV